MKSKKNCETTTSWFQVYFRVNVLIASSYVTFKKAKPHVPASTGTAKAHERTAPQNLDSVSESCLLCLSVRCETTRSSDTRLSYSASCTRTEPLRSNRGQIPWCPFRGSIILHSILVLSFCFYNNAHGLERKSCECDWANAPSIQRVHGGGAGPALGMLTYSWVGGAMGGNNIHLVF